MSEQAERLFNEVVAMEPQARIAFIDSACEGQKELRDEVFAYLADSDAAENFFHRLNEAVFSSSSISDDGGPDSDLPDLEFRVGEDVGHYRIGSLIGRGGMGTVFRARDMRLDRDVALKFLPPHLSADADERARLLAEARAAAVLDHPNVCTVHEVGETSDGTLFISMPCYGGETVKERLRAGPLSVGEAVAIGVQIARGLAAAHSREIIHRDVKPGNVILLPDGSVRLVDFGLAMVMTARVISSGTTPGTVAYMSPEQIRGEPLGSSTDLWSLGVVLYEMLAGARPFGAADRRAVINAILHEQPEPIGRRAPAIDPALSAIVERLLEKDSANRYERAADVASDLENLVRPRASASRRSPVRRAALWFSAAAIAVILLIAAMVNARRNGAPNTDSNRIVVVPFRISTADSSVKYLGEGVADLIAPMLTGEGGPLAVDSRTTISAWNRITRGRDGTAEDARRVARELGAGLALSGAVVDANGRLTITGNIISRDAGDARALTSVAGPVDSVDKLLDRFVSQLLVRESGVAETSIAGIVSQSLPAIRAYLDGRVAYRHGDQNKAIVSFTRAIDIDSTFALAALDLAVATGKLLRMEICRNNRCRYYSIVPGFASSDAEDNMFRRAIGIAWDNRTRLARRDRPLLDALRGEKYPLPNSARQTMDNLVHAVGAAPDRPETQYLLGTLMLYQGGALGISDWLRQAESAFRAASRLDSSYSAPLARLVDVAVLTGDTAQVRRAANVYLAHDNIGQTSTYVRWLLAVATRDTVAHDAIRSRFRSLDGSTLDHIYLMSQMTGLAVDDADTAAVIRADNASDPLEKSVALRRLSILAHNRGRPHETTRLLRQMDELRSSRLSFLQFTISSSLFGDGDQPAGDASGRELERVLARDTARSLSADDVRNISPAMITEALWYLNKGDVVRAASAAAWIRRHAEGQPRNPGMVLLTEMIIASRTGRADGARLRARVDSISLEGCCKFVETNTFLLARAYEQNGEPAAALRTIRRGIWLSPPRELSSWLREEGRLAAQLGARAEAIKAYEHYLALRSKPEPSLRAQRDSVRAELDRLKRIR